VSQAAINAFASRMRPAGRDFETPGLYHNSNLWNNVSQGITSAPSLQQSAFWDFCFISQSYLDLLIWHL